MTYHLDVDSELRFEVEHDSEVQLEVISCSVYISSVMKGQRFASLMYDWL